MTGVDSAHPDRGADIDDVLSELGELEEMVDRDEELRQVRETMRTARQVRPYGFIGRFQSQFGLRDAGEALVGSFVFGMPLIVEEGTLEIGQVIGEQPLVLLFTLVFGGAVVFGILHVGDFNQVAEDRLFGVVALRPVAIITIAGGLAVALMTLWGRVSWSDPLIAGGQTLLVGIVMSVGASLGDILPEN